MKKLQKYIPVLVIFSLAVIAWHFNLQQYFSLRQLKSHQLALENYIQQQLILSVLVFAGIYITTVALSFPGATFLTLAGGLLFGQILGTCVVVIAATLGASIIFYSAKLATSDINTKKVGKWIVKMQDGFKEDAFYYLLTLRLVPLFPFVVVNLVCALVQISFKTFVVATFIGIIPGSFVYVSLGVAMREVIQQPDFTSDLIVNPKILLALAGLGMLSLIPVIYKRWHRRG